MELIYVQGKLEIEFGFHFVGQL